MSNDITLVVLMCFIHFSVLTSVANTNRYNSHKLKLFEVLMDERVKGVLTQMFVNP